MTEPLQKEGAQTLLTIRCLNIREMVFPVELAAREGWNPGLYDGVSFYEADPAGFFLAELDGGMAGCISAVRFGDTLGYIGGHIVLPPFRGRGIGEALWQHAMGFLDGRVIGTDGLPGMEDFYKRYGFIPEHRISRYGGKLLDDACLGIDVYSALEVDPKALIEYDRQMFGCERQDFLSAWIGQPGVESACYKDRAGIKGYGVIRACRQGWRVGPLFADTPEIARRLLCHLACKAGEDRLYMDVPESNPAAVDLAASLGMERLFSRLRLYSGEGLELPVRKIFGLTTLDLG